MSAMLRSLIFISLIFTLVNASAYEITDLKSIKGHEHEITKIKYDNRGISEFPKEILTCPNLVELSLANNGIINLPIELGNLGDLKVLNLSGNQGLSFVDLDELLEKAKFKLETLNLDNCEMGFIPQQIGRQKSLKNLHLAGNLLNNLPYPIIQLTKLEVVDISNNRIEDISWQVHQWWNLKDLNVRNNPSLKLNELIFSLSVKDGMRKLEFSHAKELPHEFQDLEVDELLIYDSYLPQFPRVETSKPIKRLSFINCTFGRSPKIVTNINDYARPQFLRLNGLKLPELANFLTISVDSVDIKNNQLKDIRVLAGHRNLKWIDARDNAINELSINTFKNSRPDIRLVLSESVAEFKGVNPPIPELAPKAITKKIKGDSENIIMLGRTMFEIPENTFMDENRQIYTGPVNLSYTEYVSTTSIFLSGITMTSDSANENLMFSSAGMFSLNATDNQGKELQMNPEKQIQVDMLSSSPETNMNLYVLDENGVWVYKGKDEITEPFKIDMAKVDSAANEAFLNYTRKNIIVTENRFVPHVKKNSETQSFSLRFQELITERGRKGVIQDNKSL